VSRTPTLHSAPAGTGVQLPEDGGKGTPVGRGARRPARLAIIAGAVLLGMAALSSFLPGSGGQGGGSPSSSFSHKRDGASAWAELLSRFGRPVDRLRGDLDASPLDPAATVVVLDAPGLSEPEAEALGAFVRRGGHLVVGGIGTDEWLGAVVDDPPLLADDGVRTAAPAGTPAAPEVEGLRTVRASGFGSWEVPGQLRPILTGDEGRVLALAGDSGSGRVVALADPTPVQNGFLAAEDNAALALGMVGNPARKVLFAEGVHGYGSSEGLSALPRRWRLTLAGLGVAAAVWLYARSRRLGPPEDEARPLPPPRRRAGRMSTPWPARWPVPAAPRRPPSRCGAGPAN
jgi:hypothetical protein